MNINPAQVKLPAWDAQRFQIEEGGKVVTGATWRLEPLGRGTVTNGIYTAPKYVLFSRSVMVVATAKNGEGNDETVSGVVELSNTRTWIVVLSVFLFLMGSSVLYTLFHVWPRPQPTTQRLAIGPSSVVLKKGDSHVFFASAPVKWSDNAPNGTFTATTDSGTAQVTVMGSEGGDTSATAQVTVADTALTVTPVLPTLHSGETLSLVAHTTATDPQWTSELCDVGGICTAPATIAEERIVMATVTTTTPRLTASVPIRLVPSVPSPTTIIVIAMLFGALGGLLHAVNSLVAFVGSAKFVSSWTLFYFARPFVGAVMALFVFLVFKGQIAADTIKTTDLFAVAAVAGLVGLFSDRATEKLKEIFEVALGPKVDARSNKLQAGDATKPSISNITPGSVTKGTAPSPLLVVKGSGFADKCKGQINGKYRLTTFQSASQVTVVVDPADIAAPGLLVVTIVNPNGEVTDALNVPVV